MLRLTTFLLLGTTVFAQYYEGHQQNQRPSAYPMDFNDDIYNRDMRGPPERLVFNFEQRRIDQPPQYEVRDENLRQYMGRPKTTPPPPETTRFPEMPAQVPVQTNYMHRPQEMRAPVTAAPMQTDPKKWGPISSHLPATLPPAPEMPKWMDLSDDSLNYQSHQAQSRPNAPAQHHWDHRPAPQYQGQASANTHQYDHAPARDSHSSRGNHKFSWSDVKVPEPSFPTTTVSSAPMQHRNPPPSFPTLTPWHDGFGK